MRISVRLALSLELWPSAGLPCCVCASDGHTYATFSLAAGVSLFTLPRRMGTSVDMTDKTYGHLAADAEEYERGLLDAWDSTSAAEATERNG